MPSIEVDPYVAHVERESHQDAILAFIEDEFSIRAKITSDSHKMYSNIAHRFISLLEADVVAARNRLALTSDAPQYYATPSSRALHSWTLVSKTPSSKWADDEDDGELPPGPPPQHRLDGSPTHHQHAFFLSATKLDQTDPRLVPSHSKSPIRGSKWEKQQSAGPSSSAYVDANKQQEEQQRLTSIAHITMKNTYQKKRRECTVRRLDQQINDQAAVVGEFQVREAKRVEAFRRREAMLLKRAMDNEARNSVAATERGRLELKHFDATKPLRLHVESKGEASRVSLKKNLLKEQATARAARRMDQHTSAFVTEKEKQFEQQMATLQEIAIATHHQQTIECSHSKAMLSSVLANRNAKQGRYQRAFHQHMVGVLSARKRQDFEDISGVVRARHAEPIGVEVSWSSDDEDENPQRQPTAHQPTTSTVALLKTPQRAGAAGQNGTTSQQQRTPMSEARYARLCGATESAVRGIAGISVGPGIASPSLFGEMMSPVIRGATHVGWR
ncbi:Hypothetical protein, putative [Bodo saltans]|uniref:Uncharacterized protein n=1 Tax=Bodo saltans TaxID=75058 RepID=A0A0S4JA18_BODSA|nr:Hypothetical protein, putative [Bodo saltans]|eukprot:CUG86322.1 Hypothetical protein, putative [Bodo saltans]